jgi:hypothetical protein
LKYDQFWGKFPKSSLDHIGWEFLKAKLPIFATEKITGAMVYFFLKKENLPSLVIH